MKKIFVLLILIFHISILPVYSKTNSMQNRNYTNFSIPQYAKIMNEVDSTSKNDELKIRFPIFIMY